MTASQNLTMRTPTEEIAKVLCAVFLLTAPRPCAAAVVENEFVRFRLEEDTGRCEVFDKRAEVLWGNTSTPSRLGTVSVVVEGKPRRVDLAASRVEVEGKRLVARFAPVAEQPQAWIRIGFELRPGGRVEVACETDPTLTLQDLTLFGSLLAVPAEAAGFVVVPVREGLLVPADSGLAFSQRFDTYAYEGCHMAMAGMSRDGAVVLTAWNDPYVALDLESRTNVPGNRQILYPALQLRKSARSLTLHFLGKGDHVAIARAYREVARERGWRVDWEQKLKSQPDREKLFGAINFKLWSTLDRRMNEDSSREESVRVNWTFPQAAAVAEHLKRDLKLDRVLFTLGGWIHRGYDNQHPDILPAAPECGGNAALADCARRVMELGYLFCLHDNYQDIYRDSPSWNEDYIMRTQEGGLARGGHWAGGIAYLTCAEKALELARRPQNLAAVRELTRANAYFIDTTYAAGLQECFDPRHPLSRGDDLRWKQALSDYAREVFGVFGSECGREWAIPHSDFFEGLTGVSGGYYHDAKLAERLGGVVVPLFELVYRDGIALYGKYGYDPFTAAGYVLHHLLLGRTLNYHSIPPGLYWLSGGSERLPLRPAVADFTPLGPRRFRIAYRWISDGEVRGEARIFVHFTDSGNRILFQNDHAPKPPLAQWGREILQGPFELSVPEGVTGVLDVRMGLFSPESGQRFALAGRDNGERSYLVGRLRIESEGLRFEPVASETRAQGDPSLFTRASGAWAAGLHSLDRFVKNTYELLSPLNELTSRLPMTAHAFVTSDRSVQRSVFGAGDQATEVLVNLGSGEHSTASRYGGQVRLPPQGFLVEGPLFAAVHATVWNGQVHSQPVMFTVRSLDGLPLDQSRKIRVFHLLGEPGIRVRNREVAVAGESVLDWRGR